MSACSVVQRNLSLQVYVAIRTKKGQAPEERLRNLFLDPIFSVLVNVNGSALNKVEVVPVNLEEDKCGIDDDTINTLNE